MGINYTVGIARVRQYINEPTAGFWTDAEIGAWMNDAYKEIAGETEAIEVIKTDSTIAKKQVYAINTAFTRIKSVMVDDDWIQEISWREFVDNYAAQSLDNAGTPALRATWDNNIYLTPKPSATAPTTTLRGTLLTASVSIDVADTSDFPTQGRFLIEAEVIDYQSTTTSGFLLCTRGVEGTTAIQHTATLTLTARDIEFKGYGIPDDLSGTQEPDIAGDFHILLVWYATSQALYKQSRLNEAREYERLYRQKLGDMKRRLIITRNGRYPTVLDSRTYNIPRN
mgnify:CR=1 FL=1